MKKRLFPLIMCVFFIICILGSNVYAYEKIILTKENIDDVVLAASKGDQLAIDCLRNSDMFNKDKVREAFKGIVFSSDEPEKTIVFNDGSYITVKVSGHKLPNENISEEDTGVLQPSDISYKYTGSATYTYAGSIARYTITCTYTIFDSSGTVRYESSSDSAWALKPLYWAHPLGTTPLQTFGDEVLVRGTCEYNGAGVIRDSFLFTGNANQRCTIELLGDY